MPVLAHWYCAQTYPSQAGDVMSWAGYDPAMQGAGEQTPTGPHGRRLRIALVAPPWYPVPPRGYGGVERVVHLLAQGLHHLGHHVTVFGREGTAVGDVVHELAPPEWKGAANIWVRKDTYLTRVHRLLTRARFDVVHDHSCTEGVLLAAVANSGWAAFATIHGPIDQDHACFLREVHDLVGLVAVSESQRQTATGVRWRGMIHPAIDEGELAQPGPGQHDYLVQVARIHPVKGQHIAIQVARELGLSLVLAGPVERSPVAEAYFGRAIAPALGNGVTWIEDLRGRAKGRLLAGARAMLLPLQWEEPFGLSAAEAMANGTPAIAFPVGAMPEVIDEGVTGYLVADADEMARSVALAAKLDRARCADRARVRFASRRMVHQHVGLYMAACDAQTASNSAAAPRRGAADG
jgi:glycosyltransferase involved in cell wall biosynthesis